MTNIQIWAFTFDFIGKALIAMVAILVHDKIRKEKKIDKKVLREMKAEQTIGFLGVLFLLLGYILHIKVLT